MLQLFLCCPRMNLLSFTLTIWEGAHPAIRVLGKLSDILFFEPKP